MLQDLKPTGRNHHFSYISITNFLKEIWQKHFTHNISIKRNKTNKTISSNKQNEGSEMFYNEKCPPRDPRENSVGYLSYVDPGSECFYVYIRIYAVK